MRVARPPVEGSVQMLPCISMASVFPSGETATDIEVPSCTVTSIRLGVGTGAAPSAAMRKRVATSTLARNMRPPGYPGILYLPHHESHSTRVIHRLCPHLCRLGDPQRSTVRSWRPPAGVHVARDRPREHGWPCR